MKMREQIAQLVFENAELTRSNESYESEIRRLNTLIQDKLIVAMLSATESVKASSSFLMKIQESKCGCGCDKTPTTE